MIVGDLMDKIKNLFKSKLFVFILIIIIVSLLCFFIYQHSKYCVGSFCRWNGKDRYGNYFNEREFDILDLTEFYVIFHVDEKAKPYKSAKDMQLYDIYTLIFDRFDNSDGYYDSIRTEKISSMYAYGVCFSRIVPFDYIDFDNYKYDAKNDAFNIIYDKEPKRNTYYAKAVARKRISYKYVKGYYEVDVQYLFTNNEFMYDKGANIYGSLDDISDVNKKIVSSENIDAQKYLDDNYDSIKDKLDTYHYVIKVLEDGRILLMDFKVN